MTPRIFAALMAGACAGSLLLPGDTMARSGGMAPAMHAPAMRAPFAHPSPWARPGFGPRAGRFHHRAIPGFAWPLAAGWFGVPAVSEFDGGTGAYPDAPYPPPAPAVTPPSPTPAPVVQQVTRIIVIRGGCESTPETIRWRDGSVRTITMVRC